MFGARTQGILFAIAAAVCYGLNPLGAKSLYAAGLTADSVLFYRYALAAALLGAWVAWRGEGFRLTRRECAWAAALGGCWGRPARRPWRAGSGASRCFGEALTPRGALGVLLILGAVTLISLLPAAPRRA